MSRTSLILRHICFTGPSKPPASLSFQRGLNVLYGASETGKSFVLESIDYMLGGNSSLRDIPERVGYDQIFLGIETENGEAFTFVRSTDRGAFYLFQGLHQQVPAGIDPVVLKAKHSSEDQENLSNLLLNKISMSNKRLKKNARCETKNLSFRDLVRLCLINEGDIQKQGTPIESGDLIEDARICNF